MTTKGLAALALTVGALVRMPAVTAQETTRTVTVAANKTWQTTGIVLSNQNFVDIQYVTGKWRVSKDGALAGPGGSSSTVAGTSCFPSRNTPGGALIARIGSKVINLGVMLDIAIKKPDSTYGDIVRLEGTGPLSLRVNDCDEWLGDNSGSIQLRIKLSRAKDL